MLLEIKNLTHYFGGLCAVSDFDLNLARDELIGIIGPNGAGKTTIFNLITGVYRPRKGSIIFKERELIGKRPSEITRLGIARTFQNIRLFGNLSILDNVRIAHYSRMRHALCAGLFQTASFQKEEQHVIERSMDLLERFKLDEHAETQARNLPYGMQRRLEIVRALATEPDILLLDEPAAGMHPGEIAQLMEFIQAIKDEFKLTIILIEHQMKLVMGICQRLLVLDFGVTIARGSPEHIRNNPKVLEAYLGEDIT